MQERHLNRRLYFDELAETTEKYFISYLNEFIPISSEIKILEIGCGEGGNLLSFAKRGCAVAGIDISKEKIDAGTEIFKEMGIQANLICSDFFDVNDLDEKYDIILIHDVIEHITNKESFLNEAKKFLNQGGIFFIAFPAWQMPFGGHQQACHNKYLSKMPFIHLLPARIYKWILSKAKEPIPVIDELLDIKKCRVPIEKFRKLAKRCQFEIRDEQFYFINPHYEIKFNLKPRKLTPLIGKIPYIRNFFTTSCFYILQSKG